MPGSLFLKIFLWFFLTLLVVAGMTFVISEVTRPQPFRPHGHGPADIAMSAYAESAAEIYEREGQNALAAYLDHMQSEDGINCALFSEYLDELTGRHIPAGARELAERAMRTRATEFGVAGFPSLLARPVTTTRGGQYVLVAEMPPQTLPPHLLDHVLHLGAVLLVGVFFCYWLARYLTAPVTKLRAATRELASGNLSARVGPSLGKRRDELASLGADFDLMAEQIESLLKSQRRLLGDISHELRSPLARLNVALELARQRSGPAAISALERIQREAETLNEMIGQLLAITRPESGAQALKTEIDLARLLRQIADDADFEARSRNRTVRINACETCIIGGTEDLLRRAIENVIRNALQYTAAGTEVQIDLHCFPPAVKADEELAVITVRDHGAGVPEPALTEIFRPFYRVEDARDRESGGAGLGLAITERCVKLHGGTAAAANAIDGGLVVTISLPALTPVS